ncbi:MAG: SPOR domain-containing protein [Alkaliphilus sp.]
MKRVRAISRKKYGKKNNMTVLFFLIIMASVAIYAGLIITEKWINPVFDTVMDKDEKAIEIQDKKNESIESSNTCEKKDIETNEIKTKDVGANEIRSFSIHTIQVASLNDKENVGQLVKYLGELKLPHLVYKKNGSYKIYTKGFTNREHAKNHLDEIRNYFPDAFLATWEKLDKVSRESSFNLSNPQLQFTKAEVNSINEEVVVYFNELFKLLEAQSDELYNYYKKEGELELYVELLTKHQTLLENLSNNIMELSSQDIGLNKEEIETMIKYQKNNTKESLILIHEKTSKYKVHSLFLDSLFRVADVIS